MKPEDPGPLKKKDIRDELKAKYRPMLDEGVANMQKALEIDQEYDDAMAYMNLLIRYRADLRRHAGRVQEGHRRGRHLDSEDLTTKKMKAERLPKSQGITNDTAK